MNWTLHCGDARSVLASLPDGSVNCVVTSPPYWGLRDYGHADQIGLEPSPDAFVAALVGVFEGVRRVLRPDGVVWLNLGDSYSGSGKGGNPDEGKQATNRGSQSIGVLYGKVGDTAREAALTNVSRIWTTQQGIKPKQLIGVPWRAALELQANGWYLRSDVIWAKPNQMPESVTDRPTKAHEYVFLLTKSERYAYNADAIREKYAESTLKQFEAPYDNDGTKDYAGAGVQNPSDVKARIVAKARKQDGHGNRRYDGFNDRWDSAVAKSNYKAAQIPGQSQHGYTMRDDGLTSMAPLGGANARTVWQIATEPSPYEHFAVMPKALARKCILAGCPMGGTVLDPFAGVCTTGVVALEEGRSFIGIELNSKYHAMGRERLANVAPLLATEVPA